MCFLPTTFPNAPEHPPPPLYFLTSPLRIYQLRMVQHTKIRLKIMVIKMIAISTFQYIILYIIGNNDSRKVLDFLIRNVSKKILTNFFSFYRKWVYR